jgi:hypothetical protein
MGSRRGVLFNLAFANPAVLSVASETRAIITGVLSSRTNAGGPRIEALSPPSQHAIDGPPAFVMSA